MNVPEPCTCPDFGAALAEEMFTRHEWARDGRTVVLYILPHPSGDEDEGRLMLFCPFCGGPAGDGLQAKAELWVN